MGMRRDDREKGDAGAGRIFFISTVGSVAGVLLTDFVFIPNLTNFRSMLLLGLALTAASASFAMGSAKLSRKAKRGLISSSLVVATICAILMIGKNSYMKLISASEDSALAFEIRAEYTSMFGNVKVVDVLTKNRSRTLQKILIQDGLIHNLTTRWRVAIHVHLCPRRPGPSLRSRRPRCPRARFGRRHPAQGLKS